MQRNNTTGKKVQSSFLYALVLALSVSSVWCLVAVWPATRLDATQQSEYDERRLELIRRQQRDPQPPPPTHFKSGGERSEILLRDISATLKSIDKRLQTIEQTFVNLQGGPIPPSHLPRGRR